MRTNKHILATLTIAAIVFPAAVFADTTDVQSQVQSLLSQIKALQAQLVLLLGTSTRPEIRGPEHTASSTPQEDLRDVRPCVQILHELKTGTRGDEVSTLQKFLKSDATTGFRGSITGFFGQFTAAALAKFEQHEGIASTTPGVLATSTRDHLAKPCPPPEKHDHDNATSTRPFPPRDDQDATSTRPIPPTDDHGPRPLGALLVRGSALVFGTVTQNSGSTITINSDGGSKNVIVSATTTITIWSASSTEPTLGTTANITVGIKARAIGTLNSDGSINASTIQMGQIRPINF